METTKLDDGLSRPSLGDGPIEILRSRLREYCKGFPSLTDAIENLSALSGVSSRTLWRIASEESKKPYASTVIALFKVFNNESSQEKIVEGLEPSLRRYVSQRADPQFDEDDVVEGPKGFNRDILNDSTFRQILFLTQTRDVPISEIKENFGNHGLRIVKSLDSYGMIKIDNDRITHTNRIVEIDTEATYKISCDLLSNYYQLHSPESEPSHLHFFLLGRLNRVAYNEISKIDKKAYEEKCKIFREKSNAGDIPIWTISAVGTTDASSKRVLQ